MPEPPGIEVGRMLELRPEDGDADSVTVLENPLVGATVMVEVPETLVLSDPIAVGLAAMVKSGVGGPWTTNFPIIKGGE
ncbi:hypothetical protein AUF78_17350 [archaeon 13_1_20CM_2_51_12]|nr:MAG: hypothetical protein AUF78_17350 [archaeon 13_1_20CM_2_51_12]